MRAGNAVTAPKIMRFLAISVLGGFCPKALNAPQNASMENADRISPKDPARHPIGTDLFGMRIIGYRFADQ
jgi:hypothetical protein